MSKSRIRHARLVLLSAACSLAAATAPALAQRLTTEPWDAKTGAAEEISTARSGNLAAQMSLVRRYETGDGVERNADLAADYAAAASLVNRAAGLAALRRIAAGGTAHAQMLLGRVLLADSDPAARAEGMDLLAKAGDVGSAEANFILGTRLAAAGNRGDAAKRLALAERAGGKTASFARFVRERMRGTPRQAQTGQWTDVVPVVEIARFDRGKARVAPSLAFWGLDDSNYWKPEAVRGVVSTRLFELAEAAYSGDVAADYVFAGDLARRCGEQAKIDRWACAALIDDVYGVRDFALYSGRPKFADLARAVDAAKVLELAVGGPPDLARARAAYAMIVEKRDHKGLPEAAYRLSQMYDKGLGGRVDKAKASEMFTLAADYRQPTAAFALALDKLRRNDMDGLGFYLQAAADGGNADAAYYYAKLLSENKILVKNGAAKIFKYFQQAAEAGNKNAFYSMGEVYWNGWGVPKDEGKAEYWWMAAARIGDPKAADHVATLFSQRSDWAGAIPWLRRAAQGGYPGAQGKLDRVIAAGYHERNLAGFLAGVFQFVGDVGQGMAMAYQAQYEAEQAEIRRSMAFYVLPAAGSDSGGSGGSGGSAGAGGAEGSSFDEGGASGSAFAEGGSGYGADSGSGGGGDGFGAASSGSGDGGSGAGSGSYASGDEGGFASADGYSGSGPGGGSGGSGAASGSGGYGSTASSGDGGSQSSLGAIIVEQLPPPPGPTAEEIAAQQRAVEYAAKQDADRAAMAQLIKEGLEKQAADLRDFETNPCRNTFPAPESCYPNAGKGPSKVSPQ